MGTNRLFSKRKSIAELIGQGEASREKFMFPVFVGSRIAQIAKESSARSFLSKRRELEERLQSFRKEIEPYVKKIEELEFKIEKAELKSGKYDDIDAYQDQKREKIAQIEKQIGPQLENIIQIEEMLKNLHKKYQLRTERDRAKRP